MNKRGITYFELLTILIILGVIFSVFLAFIISPTTNNINEVENHTGKCLEYKTEYKLDCGLFVGDNFCKERKYDVCIRWEE